MALGVIFLSCTSQKEEVKRNNDVSDEIISKLQAAGFVTSEGLRKFEDGYLVEYDIYLTESQINELAVQNSEQLNNGRTEHFATTYQVNRLPRTITVFMDPTFGSFMQNAFDDALARYNDLGISLTLNRTTNSSTADIRIVSFFENSTLLGISGGFPAGGNPANLIRLNTFHYNNSSMRADATTTIAHEIGHAIGFRHTDFMNRAFSCITTGGNEGDAGVGAVNIPGTPTTPSSASWMLACSSGGDRPFTSQDRISLRTLYPATSTSNRYILNGGFELLTGQSMRSIDSRFRLTLQSDGNLVLYDNLNRALWSSGTNGKPVTRCLMQNDGNLVLYDNNFVHYWASNTHMFAGAYLRLQDDGNLVIYQGSAARWASNTCCR